MGRRAKKAPVQTKKRPTLAKRFKCPFCANEDVVECKMNFRQGTGSLACRLCGASYQMPIHHLHEPVDVFSEWLDDCEAAERANGGGNKETVHDNNPNHHNNGPSHPHDVESDDDSDHETNHIPASSGLSSRPKPSSDPPPKTSKSKPPAPTQTYASLGLDDSDDDDSE